MNNDSGTDLTRTTVHGVAWSFIERFSMQGVTFVLELIIARIVGPESYGLIAMLAIFMAVSQVFIDGGFSAALIQRQNRSEADFSTAFYINFGLSLLVYTALFFAAPWIADFFRQPLLTDITRVYSVNLVLFSLVAVNKTKLTIDVDFKTQSKISLLSAILSGVLGIALAYAGWGVWAIVWQTLVNALLNAVFSFYYVRWWPRGRFSKTSFHNLFGFGSKLLITNMISALYAKAYDVVVGHKFNPLQLGLYSRADKFNQFGSSNISGILQRVSFPVLSRIQDDDARLLEAYRKYLRMSAFVVFPIIMGLCGIARPMIQILLGQEWMGTVPLLQILSFAYLWDCVVIVNLNLIYVKGRSDYALRLEVVKKTIAFTILFASLGFGLTGICIGRVLYALIAFYLNTYYTRRLLNYGFLTQVRELLPYIAMSLVVVGISYTLSALISNAYASLAASLVVCPAVYVLMCRVFGVKAFNEFCDLLLHQFKWKRR